MTSKSRLIAALLFLASPAVAADIDSLKADCEACHGPNGISAHPDIPIIAGQTAKFLAKTLRGFQMWDRPCVKSEYPGGPKAGQKTDMCKVAGALGDADIKALADWYASKPFVPAKQEFDPALAAAGEALHAEHCESCHEQGGKVPDRGPRLAGQWTDYMAATVKFVPTGEHMVPPMMERRVMDFSKEEITQLMNYYASQQEQ